MATAGFPIVYLKDYDIAEKTIQFFHVNHMIEEPKIVNAEAEKNLRKAELNFIVDLETLTHKTSVDPKLSHLRICLRINQKERALEELSPVFTEYTERFGYFLKDMIL